MRVLVCFGLLAGGIVVRAQAPMCLIGQPPSVNGSAIIDLMNPMANELDSVGQLHSVTYAIEDPIVRDAFLANKITKPQRFFTFEDVLTAAKTINIPYVLWIEGQNANVKFGKQQQKVLNCKVTLYKNGKKVYEDTDNQSVSLSKDGTPDDTIRSVMSSLNTKMQSGPLKGLQKYPKAGIPIVGKGQSPIIPETNDDDPVLNDWIAIQERVKNSLADRKFVVAEMLLRDAVDAAPADANRRRALIDFLQTHNRVDAAVDATISAAEALGDPTLIVKAARILMENNQVERAGEIIKDAIVTDPTNPTTQLMEAELRMRAAMPDQALKHLEIAIKAKPSAEAYFLRGICRALLGAEDGVKLDMDRASKEDPQIFNSQYPRMGMILDAAFDVEGPDLKSLLAKAAAKRTAEEVTDAIDGQDRMAKACIALIVENPANIKYDKSHGMRLLALNLLLQSLTELRHYTAKGDQESLDESRTDLTETLKTFAEAKAQFLKESTDARNSDPPR